MIRHPRRQGPLRCRGRTLDFIGPAVLVVAFIVVGLVAFAAVDQGIGLIVLALAALVVVDHFIVKEYRKRRTLEQRRRSWGIRD